MTTMFSDPAQIAPEVSARPATPEQIPAGAKRLADAAREHGFHVWTTYARGVRLGDRLLERRPLVDVNTGAALLTDAGRPRCEIVDVGPKVSDSIAVRMHRGSLRLVGLWVDGSYSTGLSANPMRVLNSIELSRVVKGGDL